MQMASRLIKMCIMQDLYQSKRDILIINDRLQGKTYAEASCRKCILDTTARSGYRAEAWILAAHHTAFTYDNSTADGFAMEQLYTLTKILQSVTSRMSIAGMKLRFSS